jgi:hypothetical protein
MKIDETELQGLKVLTEQLPLRSYQTERDRRKARHDNG